jgi:hypothetical protein
VGLCARGGVIDRAHSFFISSARLFKGKKMEEKKSSLKDNNQNEKRIKTISTLSIWNSAFLESSAKLIISATNFFFFFFEDTHWV